MQLTWGVAGDTASTHQGRAKLKLDAEFSNDPTVLTQTDETVTGIVDRFAIYKFEREAQRAQERGDVEKAREKLGAATRELRRIGEGQLAEDMEGQIAVLNGAAVDPSRIKRIKSTTRRLGNVPSAPEPARPRVAGHKGRERTGYDGLGTRNSSISGGPDA